MKDPEYDPVKFQRELILKLAGNPEVIKMCSKRDDVGEHIANLAERIADQYEVNVDMY